jgi:hypothetical protein
MSPNEPPLIERARRLGWALLLLCLILGGAVRFGGAGSWALGLAVACGLLGLLSVFNVILVRSLYRQLGDMPAPTEQEPDA